METQYYVLYKDSDSYVMDDEIFRDENYVELFEMQKSLSNRGKKGRYVHVNTNSAIGQFHFAFVGCRIEDMKSKIVRIDLDHPVIIPPKPPQLESEGRFELETSCVVMIEAVRGERKMPPPVSGIDVDD